MNETPLEGKTTILKDGSVETYLVAMHSSDDGNYVVAVVKDSAMVDRFETGEYMAAVRKYAEYRKLYLRK